MKSIKLSEYNPSMGTLIDVEEKVVFDQGHIEGAINIPYQTLIYNFKNILKADKSYYIYCKKGFKSRRAVNILELYHYNVTQVLL